MLLIVAAMTLTASPAVEAKGCPHPYFPIEEGLRLTYRAGKEDVQVRFTDVKAGEENSGQIEMALKGRSAKTDARCTADGILTGAGGLEGLALQSSGMDMTIEKTEGVVLPPPSELVPGKSWKNTFKVKMRPPNVANSGGLKGAFAGALVMRTTLTKESTVVGPDKVTTAAGTFEAIKVVNKTSALGGDGGSQRMIESHMWLVPRLGIVKIMTGQSVDFELLKVERAEQAAAK